MVGFHYRYRLNGGEPTIEMLPFQNAGTVAAGDLMTLRSQGVAVAVTGDRAMLGAATESASDAGTATSVGVITDVDAVYAVRDAGVRAEGVTLDVSGDGGGHGVGTSVNADLVVVVASGAGDETLVRINDGRHAVRCRPAPTALSGVELNAAIARAMVRCHRRYLGRGPTKARAFHRGNVIVVVLEDTLTKPELSLVAGGRDDLVAEVREALRQVMKADLVATVERLTGCRVDAFMGSHHTDPDIASALFVLDRPVPGGSSQS
jgi:uncharacterized protein YbcI